MHHVYVVCINVRKMIELLRAFNAAKLQKNNNARWTPDAGHSTSIENLPRVFANANWIFAFYLQSQNFFFVGTGTRIHCRFSSTVRIVGSWLELSNANLTNKNCDYYIQSCRPIQHRKIFFRQFIVIKFFSTKNYWKWISTRKIRINCNNSNTVLNHYLLKNQWSEYISS